MSIGNVQMSRTVVRAIKDLQLEFFVRKSLNDDWVMQLAELITAGTELDPILITEDGKVVDGRHRIEAHLLTDRTEIKSRIVQTGSDVEMIVLALQQNMGGSLPPSREDIEHTILSLLDRGVPKKQLADTLTMLPPSLVKKYLTSVESKMRRSKLQKAANAVAQGDLNVPQAVDQYNVKEDELKALLSGSVRRKGKGGVADLKLQFSSSFKSHGQRTASAIKRLLDLYEDGEASHKEVHAVFAHVEGLLKTSTRTFAQWRKRFEAMEAPKKLAS